jgi:hypothetical protein
MAKALTPAQIAEKQVRRAQAAVTDYKDGVMAVKVSPTQKAAQRVDAWMQGLQKAYADGSSVDGLKGVSLQDWQKATVDKGGMTYAKGVADAQGVISDFHAQRQQEQARIDAQLNAMPRGDLSTNIQRMIMQIQGMSNFKFKKRRN